MANSSMFKCPACGHGLFRVVAIQRENKPAYETEFIACSACKVMQWTPGSEPKNRTAPPLLASWGKKTEE